MIAFSLVGSVTGEERWLAFKYACAGRRQTIAETCREMGYSVNHVYLVVTGKEARRGSEACKAAIARVVGMPVEAFFGAPEQQKSAQ